MVSMARADIAAPARLSNPFVAALELAPWISGTGRPAPPKFKEISDGGY